MCDLIKIFAPDPTALADRLNQPRTTRIEALQQLQESGPLTPSAKRELEEALSAYPSEPPAAAVRPSATSRRHGPSLRRQGRRRQFGPSAL